MSRTPQVDILTIFPEYLGPLELSLVGAARRKGIVDIGVHDLRDWATGRHRTVDDTPFGGGAGMVMRPDVWGEALDDVLDDDASRRILLLPTPAGVRFTQRDAEELAGALLDGSQLVIACGRYEGIDSRVAEHYASRDDVDVREISLGDYVLNGGEVAAIAVVEAVVRLIPGVLGNPASVIEESHSEEGLLEHPVYTQPASWRGHDVPEILRSGDHPRIARWRRAQAVARTVDRRPDLLRARGVLVRAARRTDAADLAELAAATFPAASPADVDAADIQAYIEAHLSPKAFRGYLTDSRRWVLIAEIAGVPVGYSMTVAGEPEAPIAAAVPTRPTAELNKFYLLAEHRGTGAAASLMIASLDAARERGLPGLWLGVNARNTRAKAFYRRHGFERIGARSFTLGARLERDDVLYRSLG